MIVKNLLQFYIGDILYAKKISSPSVDLFVVTSELQKTEGSKCGVGWWDLQDNRFKGGEFYIHDVFMSQHEVHVIGNVSSFLSPAEWGSFTEQAGALWLQ